MKKIFLICPIILALAFGVYAADIDHFILILEPSTAVAGTEKSLSIEARDTDNVKKDDYAGTVYLTLAGGGEVLVGNTGGNTVTGFVNGLWSGTVRILMADGAVAVYGQDSVSASAAGLSGAVTILAGPYSKIKLLSPGMVFAPGSVTGYTGTPDEISTQCDFGVTVYACDDWHNPVVPPSATGIKVQKLFSSGYINVTPYCDDYTSHDIFSASASSITFTVSVWPVPNNTQPYSIKAIDESRPGFVSELEISFYSLVNYYFKTNSPAFVTAGVPFRVTVKASHFPPPNETPDITYTDLVRLKAVNPDGSDASPVVTNAQLTPIPTPMSVVSVGGEAYFDVAYTKTGGIRMMPIQAGIKPVLNYLDPTSYSAYITIYNAAAVTFTAAAADNKLLRGASTLLTVRPYDVFGNPVTGTAVNFSIVSGYGTLAAASVNTDGNGAAIVNYTAPAGNFENIIRATVAPVTGPLYVTVLSELTNKFENWPNPFIAGKETTKINYSLAEDSEVEIRLYSSFGKLVWSKDIAKGEVAEGENHGKKGGNTVIWDGKADKGFITGAGVYILKMTITNSMGTITQTRKIAVVK